MNPRSKWRTGCSHWRKRGVARQAQLFAAVQAGDLAEGRRLNYPLEPLVRVFYAPTFVDMHNRMKEALALLGRIASAVVRPPLVRIGDAEREAIRRALIASGLLGRAAARKVS